MKEPFCSNGMCEHHRTLVEPSTSWIQVETGPLYGADGPAYRAEEVRRHLYFHVGQPGRRTHLCDRCHNAAQMVRAGR